MTHSWKERFEEQKSRLFPDDKVVLVKTFLKTEYLHKTLPVWDLMTGKVTPAQFIVSETYKEGAVDEREVEAVEKSWKQSEVIKSFIAEVESEALQRGRNEAVDYININLMWGRSKDKKRLEITPSHIAEVLESARSRNEGGG